MSNDTTTADIPVKPAKRFDPKSVVPFNRLAAKFWFFMFMVMTAFAITVPFLMLERLKQKERLVILDESGTWHVAPIDSFQEADKMHNYITKLATGALLHRGPLGVDSPGLLKQLYLVNAHQKAQVFLKEEAPHFDSKNIHQKVEIEKIRILKTSEKMVLAAAKGQLIRVGEFEGENFTDNKRFKIKFRLVRNPRLGQNGRLPLAVLDYTILIEDVRTTEADELLKTKNAEAKQ